MLSRLALRSTRSVALAQTKLAPRVLRPVGCFHTGSIKQQDQPAEAAASSEAAVATIKDKQSLVQKYGLDDWKISLPIGLAISIPVLSNGIYVLNEETQLACCFMLFCTSVYKYGGEMVGSYFDSRAAAILHEQNEAEDANIALAKETMEAHKSMLTIQEDITALAEVHKEMVGLMCKVENNKLRHKTRETFVRNLESILEIESSVDQEIQKKMVETATLKVRAQVEQGDKQLKQNAFKHALNILSESTEDDNKQDEIVSMFIKELHDYSAFLKSQEGKVVKLSEADQKELQHELDAYVKRNGLDGVQMKAEKEVKVKLL